MADCQTDGCLYGREGACIFCGCTRPEAPKPEPVLTRAEAEQRLSGDVMERLYREAHNGYTGAYPVLRGIVLAALFPDGGE